MGTKLKKSKREFDAVPFDQRDMRRRAEIGAGVLPKGTPHLVATGPNNHAAGTYEALQRHFAAPPKKRDHSALDRIIFDNATAGVTWTEISRVTGMTIDKAQERYKAMLKENYNFSPAEMQLVLISRLEYIINSIQGMVTAGSEAHARVMLTAVQQLRELYGLAQARSEVELRIVTDEQTSLLVLILQHVLGKLFDIPEVRTHVPADIIDATAVSALEEAQDLIQQAADKAVVV